MLRLRMAQAIVCSEGDGASMRGDILLYRNGGSARDRAVCAYTRGPFCHCELDLGDGSTVGAHSEDGISYRWDIPHERIVVISLQTQTTADRIEEGLEWVLRQVGAPFSWASIADLALPPQLSTLLFGRRGVYNCANLVARYLEIAGGLELPYGKRPPMLITPNDIGRAAGLLPAGGVTSAQTPQAKGEMDFAGKWTDADTRRCGQPLRAPDAR